MPVGGRLRAKADRHTIILPRCRRLLEPRRSSRTSLPCHRRRRRGRSTSADGVEIAVYEFGGAGETLLVAHATGFCATMYRPLGAELVDRFRIVALDFRGHGRSARPVRDDDFGWDRMAEDVLAVVERLDPPIAGFGHSMGGAALLLAEERRPGTFRQPVPVRADRASGRLRTNRLELHGRPGPRAPVDVSVTRRGVGAVRQPSAAEHDARRRAQGLRRRRLRRSPRRIGPPGVPPRRRGQDVRVGDQAARLECHGRREVR